MCYPTAIKDELKVGPAVTVSGGVQDQAMESANKNYVITKQMKFDFQIVLMAKNEKEAAYHADLKEIELWTEVDSNWKIIDVSKATNLTIIKSAPQIESTPETMKAPVIQIWKKTLR